VPRVRRCALIAAATLAVVLAVPALGSSGGSADLLKALAGRLRAVKAKTTVPVFPPAALPFGGKVPRLYAVGFGSRNAWGFELDGAPNCGSANACFLASFQAKRGARLPGTSNLRLAGGQRAYYKGVTCGASCSPATLWFVQRGVLYVWQHKDPPRNAKTVLARLAAEAIAAGPR
jgi:hypothetical protein